MIIFTIVGTKGGVGKTTLSANLGSLMADLGLSVLLIDGDIQASLSKYFPIEYEAPHGLTKVIRSQSVTPDCISTTSIENLHIIRSDDTDHLLQSWLASRVNRGPWISNALKSPAVAGTKSICGDVNEEVIEDAPYDVVIIDTQGSQNCPICEAAAIAASQIIIPINPDTMSAREFYNGTMDLFSRLDPFTLGAIKGLIYKKNRTRDAKNIEIAIRDDLDPDNLSKLIQKDFIKLGGRVTMLQTAVPYAKAYSEAVTEGAPVHRHEPKRKSEDFNVPINDGKIPSASYVMHKLVWELLPIVSGCIAAGEVEDHGFDEKEEA